MLWLLYYVNTTSCLTAVVLFLLTKWYWDRHYWNKTLPPGPPSLPLLGSLPFMPGSTTGEVFSRLAKKYGDIFMVDLGLQRCVVLNRFDLVKEVYLKHGDKCLDRPNKYIGIGPHKEYGVAFSKGQSWHEQKKFTLHCLRDFGFGKKTMEEIILEELEVVSSEFAAMGDEPFDPTTICSKATLNIMATFLNGKRLDYDNHYFMSLFYHAERVVTLLDKNSLSNCFPFLRYVPIISRMFHELDKSFQGFADLAQNWINDKQEKLSSCFEQSSFIDAYLVKMKEKMSDEDNLFTGDHLKWSVVDLILAGSDTSAATMTWCLAFMLNYSDIKQKVQAEIQNVIGNRQPSLEDRMNLPYCDAVIHEIMRVSEFISSPLPRVTTEDLVVNGYYIPEGTTVMQNFSAIHHHCLNFENPRTFNPDRFLDVNGHFKRLPEFNIFSNGKRNCVGEGLARAEIFLFFVLIMQRFDLKSVNGEVAPRLDDVVYGIINHPKPFKVVAISNE